jgi:hypothetical protein
VGIKVEYGEQLVDSVLKGTYRTVGDKEHAEMIRLYAEDNLSMDQISKKLGRSSRTPMVHVNSHNAAVKRSGFFAACKRAQSVHANLEIKRSFF